MRTKNIVVIGYGYWGPHIVRNLQKIPSVHVLVYEIDQKRKKTLAKEYPAVFQYHSFSEVLQDKTLDAAIIATPPDTHFTLGTSLLASRKHVLIEKPLTTKATDAKKLIRLAKEMRKILMVGHTFIYTPAVIKLKEYIGKKMFGDLYYYDSARLNLGLFQKNTNVLWDLAVHDLSILDFLTNEQPTQITAIGTNHITKTIEDAVLFLTYQSGFTARIHVSWLSPVKIRNIVLAGSKKMALYNDVETSEKIRIYDKRITIQQNKVTPFTPAYRHGDISIPYIEQTEGLYNQLMHFISSIETKTKPLSDGTSGLRIIKLLEKAEESIKRKKTISLF